MWTEWVSVLAGVGERREKVVCGFLSRQLGEREQPHSAGADEMDEIEAGVQAQLKRGGMKALRATALI